MVASEEACMASVAAMATADFISPGMDPGHLGYMSTMSGADRMDMVRPGMETGADHGAAHWSADIGAVAIGMVDMEFLMPIPSPGQISSAISAMVAKWSSIAAGPITITTVDIPTNGIGPSKRRAVTPARKAPPPRFSASGNRCPARAENRSAFESVAGPDVLAAQRDCPPISKTAQGGS